MTATGAAWARAAATLVAVAALDQGTKALARGSLEPGDGVNVFFGIDLRLVRNTGVAFGALAGAAEWLILLLTGAAVGLLVGYFARHPARPFLWLPVGMVLGGAAGNLIDRARFGAVTDFIDPVFWPAFNVADIAVVLGVLGVLYVAEGGGDPAAGERPPAAA